MLTLGMSSWPEVPTSWVRAEGDGSADKALRGHPVSGASFPVASWRGVNASDREVWTLSCVDHVWTLARADGLVPVAETTSSRHLHPARVPEDAWRDVWRRDEDAAEAPRPPPPRFRFEYDAAWLKQSSAEAPLDLLDLGHEYFLPGDGPHDAAPVVPRPAHGRGVPHGRQGAARKTAAWPPAGATARTAAPTSRPTTL